MDLTNASVGLALGSGSAMTITLVKSTGAALRLSSTLPSFGLGIGASATTRDLVDVNGDGLPDRVEVADNGVLAVRINRGGSFDPDVQSWSFPGTNVGLGDLASEYLGEPGAISISDTVNAALGNNNTLGLQQSARKSVEVALFGVGGGLSYNATRTTTEMIDINGDGLVDRVVKLPISGQIQVQINLGTGFAAPESWSVPSWNCGSGNVDCAVDGIFNGLGLGSNDALSFTQSASVSGSAGAGLFFPIPVPFAPFCLVFELSIGANSDQTRGQVALEDIDGDGLPDEVLKHNLPIVGDLGIDTKAEMWVKLNPVGQANLLSRIDNPLGGGFDLEYDRAGNEVDMARHTVMPSNHWVMSAVTVQSHPKAPGPAWNGDPDVRTTYTYNDGFYSRRDRIFVGFGKVMSSFANGSTVEEQYATDDVYHRGLLNGRIARGPGTPGLVFDVLKVERPTPTYLVTGSGPNPRAAAFFEREKRTTMQFEGTTTDPQSVGPAVTHVEQRDFERNYGLLTSFVVDEGTMDEIRYTIDEPTVETPKYIIKPSHVVAKTASGQTLRERRVYFLPQHGEIVAVSDVQRGGINPDSGTPYDGSTALTVTYMYDKYGNVTTYVEPKAAGEAIGYAVTVDSFDALTHGYPFEMHDSFGYNWRQLFDPRTGELFGSPDVRVGADHGDLKTG